MEKYGCCEDLVADEVTGGDEMVKVAGEEGMVKSAAIAEESPEEARPFQRVRRVTGYLVGDYRTRFNDAKQAELDQRVKHTR